MLAMQATSAPVAQAGQQMLWPAYSLVQRKNTARSSNCVTKVEPKIALKNKFQILDSEDTVTDKTINNSARVFNFADL